MREDNRAGKATTSLARRADAATSRFEAASVVLPLINETTSLEATVARLLSDLGSDLGELIVVVSPRTTEASRATLARLCKAQTDRMGGAYEASSEATDEQQRPVRVVVHEQVLPHLGGALQEAFELARCSHVVMMASDLETDPATVKEMVSESKAHPEAVITATRWAAARRGRFTGYDPLKLVLNAGFQRLLALLYGSNLSDLTYGFRLFPTALVRQIHWEELGHPFLLETLIKPLRLGVQVIEVPTTWRARHEGESSNSFAANFAYLGTAVRVRLAVPASMWRCGISSELEGQTRREQIGDIRRSLS
jgi:hypothetical protein